MSFFSTGNLGFNKIIGIGVAVCEETGPNIQAPNTINTIATPQLGLDSVSNPLSARLEQIESLMRTTVFDSEIQSFNVLQILLKHCTVHYTH